MKKTINAIIITAGIAAGANAFADDFSTVVGVAEPKPASKQVNVVPNNINDLVERYVISVEDKLSVGTESNARVPSSISEYAKTL